MRALLITVPLGHGHNSVAKALSGYLERCEVQCATLDMYEYIGPLLKEFISRGYYFSMKSATLIKGIASNIYDLNEKRDVTSEFSISRLKNELVASELNHFISQYQPDMIICTQVYAAQVINILQEKGLITALTVGIITDFTVQTYWEDVDHFDYIVVPSARLAYQLAERGIKLDRVLPLGIPIAEKFAVKTERKAARRQLGLDEDEAMVLIMGGGMGFGNIESYIDELDVSTLPVQLVVVCGNNEHLFKKLRQKEISKTHRILGYTDQVDLLMDAADCMLTKPGGLTTSESLAKGLPMIMVDQLPGVEDRNVEFLLNNGAAIYASKTYSITEGLALLLNTPRMIQMKAAIDALAKPESTQNLGDFLINCVTERNEY